MNRREGARAPIVRYSVKAALELLRNGGGALLKYADGHAEVLLKGRALGWLSAAQVRRVESELVTN
jgi:hypothetical protein